jgi:hypothetical protein
MLKQEVKETIPESFRILKNEYCPACRNSQSDRYCDNFAMCFVNFFLYGAPPRYFFPKESAIK